MVDYKVVLGLLAIIISLIGYIPYFRDIFSGKTKPHAFSWFVWSVITGIGFGIQFTEKGGAGSWVTGFTAVICTVIFVLALFKGKRSFPLTDWAALVAALMALVLWLVAKQPVASVLLITATDAIAFVPTFRKAYHHPHEDTAITFGLNGLKFFISLFALESWTLTTWLYPMSLIISNWAFTLMMYIRRKQLAR